MHAFVRRRVPLRIECGNVLTRVQYWLAWQCELATVCEKGYHGKKWETNILRMILRPLKAGEGSVQLRKRILEKMRTTWRKKTVSKMAFESLENVWKTARSNLRE